MDQNVKREIILQHYQNPINKGLIADDGYIHVNMNNESCIDEIDLIIKINKDTIKDIRFDGEACAICTSATSIMIETLVDKSLEEALNIIHDFKNMIDEKEYNKDLLENSIVYEDISIQPNRKKCALLPWWGIEKAINKYKEETDG